MVIYSSELQDLPPPRKSKKRKLYGVLLAAVLLVLYFATLDSLIGSDLQDAWGSSITSSLHDFGQVVSSFGGAQRNIRVAISECAGWHDEVTASFMQSLASYKDVETTFFLRDKRWGIENIYNLLQWKNEPTHYEYANFTASTLQVVQPDVIISMTCGVDLIEFPEVWNSILKEQKTILFCIVHHSNLFYGLEHKERALIEPWMRARRVRLVTLSQHVTNKLDELLVPQFNAKEEVTKLPIPISTYPPVFHVDTFLTSPSTSLRPYFAMQGNVQTFRRNYQREFENFRSSVIRAGLNQEQAPILVIMGAALDKVEVPDDLKPYVEFKYDLPYPAFYNTLHQSLALLPAFADEAYITTKASSTIPAAIIAGTPLIASELLLKQYTYLAPSDVYLRKRGETEADASLRLLAEPPLIRSKLAASILKTKNSLIGANKINLLAWLKEARKDIDKQE